MNKLEYFCCICMQKSNVLLKLKSVDDNKVKYSKKLSFCVSTQNWKDTYRICSLCVPDLDVAYNFTKRCLESEIFRKEDLDGDKNLIRSTEGSDDIKSHVDIRDIKFTCDHCNKSFRQKKYLSQHITKLHIINRKSKEGSRRAVKKERDDNVVKEVHKQESSSNVKLENLTVKGEEPIKEEKCLESTESLLDNDKLVDKQEILQEEVDLKEVKSDPSDTEDLGDTTDAGYDDIENYGNYCESEIDADPDKLSKRLGKKRGPKKEPLKCRFCDAAFSKRHEWATHIRTKHTFQKPFSCDLCDARYMNGYSLLIHKRKHTNEKPFICATCGKSFVSSADLNHHNKIHDADRAYPCPMCDRSFKTHSNLRTHRLQMHLDPADWKFPCNLCEKKFPIRGNLVKHLKRHAGIKEFNCHICEKRFVNRAELSLHLNTHTNQRLFKCKLCGKDYKNREGLRRHMKVVHDQGNWKAPKSEKKHLCPMCPKIFAFGNKLQRHIFTHTGEKPFKCDFCQKRFIDNYGRKVHYKKDHNVVDFHSL